jgi:hypothetical protein
MPGGIEYPLDLMEEIRAFACEELLQVSRGGNEVGGVLFGTRRDGLIRILTWRPIACEHAHGEGLVLSPSDRMNLAVQLELARQNADLKDLRPVGCFLSHLQSGVCLSASDVETYNGFFPESWQVALVICPKGDGRADAGFFFRQTGDKLETSASYRRFELEPSRATPMAVTPVPAAVTPVPAAVTPAPAAVTPAPAAVTPAPAAATPAPAAVTPAPPVATPAPADAISAAPRLQPPEPNPEPPKPEPILARKREPARPVTPARDDAASALPFAGFQTEDRMPAKERWLWAVPILLAVGIAAFVLYQRPIGGFNAIGLRATIDAQTVLLAWDGNSGAVRDSSGGEIDVTDAGANSKISMSSDQLRAGKMSYQPQSGDLGFEMTVFRTGGQPMHDSTRIVVPAFKPATQPPQLLPSDQAVSPDVPIITARPGAPPAAPPADAAPPTADPALQQQVQQLKQELAKERARGDELQNLVRILENRLSIRDTPPNAPHQP